MEALKACVHMKAAVALNPFESLNHVCPWAPCHVNRIWRVFLVRLFVDLAPPLRIEQGIGIVLRIVSRKKRGSCFRLGLDLPVETNKTNEKPARAIRKLLFRGILASLEFRSHGLVGSQTNRQGASSRAQKFRNSRISTNTSTIVQAIISISSGKRRIRVMYTS